MLSTFVFAGVLIGQVLVAFGLWALFLRLGLRWAKVREVTTRRIIGTTAAVLALGSVLNVLLFVAVSLADPPFIALGVVQFAVGAMLACAMIRVFFRIGSLRALQAWLPTLFATCTMVALNVFVVRPYLYESFVMPTNSMAPTLVGQHWRGTCPECGEPAYASPLRGWNASSDTSVMICDNFHVTQTTNVDERVHSGDRFMVAKFLNPRRWDLMVFQHPEDPSTLYAMRLVGLPGETIRIQGGAVWVDGQRQTPPGSMHGIEYLSELSNPFGSQLWGSADRPAVLGDDEYFVLGDFSARSFDSRLWERGAPGHNPFAVPESHIVGVVSHTFWPSRRWRILR